MVNFGDNKTFIENYQRLKSSRKMGELYGCNKKTITSHAKKIGYDFSGNKQVKISNYNPEEVFKLYLELGSLKAVAEKYNCSSTAVRNFLNNNGYGDQIKNRLQKLSDVSDQEFIQKYEELKSANKVGEFYGCSGTAILEHAKKIHYDPQSNKNYKLSEEDKKEIIASYEEKTSNYLAEKYHVSRGMITKLWYDTGLSGKVVANPKTTEKDLTGQTFGRWTVICKSDRRTASGSIYWKCRCQCGIERDVSGLSLRQGNSLSCGAHANISKGNEKIKQLLLNANIPFEIEKKFQSCKDKKELPFDFFVNEKYLIEYDGLQHFQESIFDYKYTHAHDLIKNEWCLEHHIPLIRIPYTHFDDLILEDLLIESTPYLINRDNAD